MIVGCVMKSKVIAILETRTGAHMAEMIERRGGVAMWAPALEEVPEVDPRKVHELFELNRDRAFKLVIFQTGVGTHALFQATDAAGKSADFLNILREAVVVARGPKPVGELNRRQVRIDIRAPSPFTTDTVLDAVLPLKLDDARVLVQRYGADNPRLRGALEAQGATVHEIATYRWALPSNIRPLIALLDALAAQRVDAVVFTSAVQIRNLYAIADAAGRSSELARQLNAVVVASIGPVCSLALREHGVVPSLEASPPKLGPLLMILEQRLAVNP